MRMILGVAVRTAVFGALLALVPASSLAGGMATPTPEQEMRQAEWTRQGQLRQQAWHAAWMTGDVRQRWLALASPGGPMEEGVRLREIRELAAQPVGEAFIARVATMIIQGQAGLPAEERAEMLARLRADIEALDADNAITWLEALPDSRKRSPETLLLARQRLQQIADSPRVDTGSWVPLMRYFAKASIHPLTRGDAMVIAAAISAATVIPFQSLTTWCREQPELREVCEAAALRLTRDADAVLTAMIGLSVLDRVAGSAERRAELAARRAEVETLRNALVTLSPNPGQVEDAVFEAFAERWFQAYAEPGATELSVIRALSGIGRDASP